MADNKEVVLYLRIDGEEYGPLTVDDVKAWIDRGKFRRTDFIRMSDKKAWVKAENLVHLKALFDEAREKQERGAFAAWLGGIREGRPPMELSAVGRAEEEKRIAEEREALAGERAVLEEQEQELQTRLETTIADREEELKRLEAQLEEERKRVTAEHDEELRQLATEREAEVKRIITEREEDVRRATEERERELERLAREHERLEGERVRLAEEERELASMGKAVKRRRRLPLFVAGAVVLLAIIIGAPAIYFFIYKPGREIAAERERIAAARARISDLERKIGELTTRYKAAIDAGRLDEAEDIAEEIEKKRKELDKLAEEVPAARKMPTTRGKAKLAGLLRAEGAGAEDPARSGGAVTAGLSRAMGGVRATYSRELAKTPGLEGHVVVNIEVAANGTVTKANVVSSAIGNSAVESAVTAAARRARFAPAAGETSLKYKFDFSP
jgi:TonB family protein